MSQLNEDGVVRLSPVYDVAPHGGAPATSAMGCGLRAVGRPRRADCSSFMRRVGIGGACPHCDEAVAVAELTGLEVGL